MTRNVGHTDDRELAAYIKHMQETLAWIGMKSGIDGFGQGDFHQVASLYASIFGRDEPNEADYCAAVMNAVDSVRNYSKGAP